MPGPSPHALTWSDAHQHYELSTNGRTGQSFRWGNEPDWQAWLAEHSAFAFIGQTGRLSVLKEARARGTGYWYAYLTRARHTHKHYLGPSTKVTFARLEQVAQALDSRSSSVQSAARREGTKPNAKSASREGIALFLPKLSRPRVSTLLVERRRLLSQLDAVRSHPLTLVSASAGSGKTTLLSSWAALFSQIPSRMETQEDGKRNRAAFLVAWLSLDSLDNDPTIFWTSVIAALRTCLPQCGQRALAMLHSSEPPLLSTMLMTLLQDLMEEDADIILILDDYHVISDLTIFDSMRFLIEHLPPQLRLVIASRTDPELPLARWRVHGHLIEIRDRDLRFTQEEAPAF